MLVLGVFVAAAGWRSYVGLPVDAFPDVSPNLVQIFTETEGLSPEDVEKYVTYPVEAAMNGLPGLRDVRSVSNFGLSVVNVYFEDDVDIYFARQILNERLQEARERIPEGFGEPVMGPISTGMGLILFYYLDDTTGTRSLEELRTIQDWLVKFHLQTVPGVTEVLGIGGWERQFQVRVHPEALLRYGLSIGEVIERIEENNLNVGAQFIERNAEEYLVRSVGLATGLADLEHIVLKSADGTPVFLDEVADVTTGGAIRRGVQTRNGVSEVVSRHGGQALRRELLDGDRRGRAEARRDQPHPARGCAARAATTSRRRSSRPASQRSADRSWRGSCSSRSSCCSSSKRCARAWWWRSRFRSRCSSRRSGWAGSGSRPT